VAGRFGGDSDGGRVVGGRWDGICSDKEGGRERERKDRKKITKITFIFT